MLNNSFTKVTGLVGDGVIYNGVFIYKKYTINSFNKILKRFNHIDSFNKISSIKKDDENNKEIKYDIAWTKEYKNLNKMLGVKGVNSNEIIDINKIKYLVFSFVTKYIKKDKFSGIDLFYSLRMVLSDFNDNIKYNRLYEKIIYNIKNNPNLIKDGGIINIYYVCSTPDNNLVEGFKNDILMPSITEKIKLNNFININELTINIYLFSYDSFFRKFLDSYFKDYLSSQDNREKGLKLWGFPFLIIEDMNLPTVTYLFKERGITAHGMSISWRHKLSPLEENLSNLLYVANLDESVQTSHLCFSDNVFTSNKLDLDLYKQIELIQEYNYNKKSQLFSEIINLNKNNSITDTRGYKFIKNKIEKHGMIEKSSINPLVIILLKRNHIFELEKRLYEFKGKHRDLLGLYQEINTDIKKMISLKTENQKIIDTLNLKIKDLELKILNLEEKINDNEKDLIKHIEINKENKNIRKLKILLAKTKKGKKKIRKLFQSPNAIISEKLNEKIMADKNFLNSKLKENKVNMDSLINIDKKNIDVKEKIKDQKNTKNDLSIEILNYNKNIDATEKDLKIKSEFTVNKDLINKVNVRKNSFNNYDFLSKMSKREYSSLSVVKGDDKLCIIDNNNNKDKPKTSISRILDEISTNPTYVKITQILNSSVDSNNGLTLSNKDKQILIEETLRYFWNIELNNMFEGKKSLFNSYVGINILMSTISKLDKVLDTVKNDKRYLMNKTYKNHILISKNGIIISIVLSNIIPHFMKYKMNQNTATVFKRIGIEIHNNLLQNEWFNYINFKIKSSSENLFYSITINNNNYKFEFGLTKLEFYDKLNEILGIISNDDYFKLGCDLSEIISQNSHLFTFINMPMEDNTIQRTIAPGKNLEAQIVNLLTADTEKLVMVSEPSKWKVRLDEKKKFKIENYGGYLLNNTNKTHFMNESFKNNGQTTLDDLKFIDCLNFLSSIPFTINYNVLNHILKLVHVKDSGLYTNEKINEIIKLNMHPDTKKLYEFLLKKKFGDVNAIQKHNSQFFSDKSIITNAIIFSNWCETNLENSIYFNYFIDWRGRLYTDTKYLSPQGGNLARSLIMFKEGKILNKKGLEHLKVYTANCYGLDKMSYNRRLVWTENNLSKILAVPNLSNFLDLSFDNKYKEFYDFVLSADEPLLFLSCCIELKNYNLNPDSYISRLPIYLDATCSGLQHLSTMINDTNLAKHVNITKSYKEDIPNDVYSHMIKFVKNKITEYIKNDISLSILDNIKITRSFIKPGIMTISYGSTSRGIAEQLKVNHFQQLNLVKGQKLKYQLMSKEFNLTKNELHLSQKEIFVLGKAIHSVLYEVFPNLTILVKYLKDMNKLLKNLNLPTIWLSPAGLIIEQKYAPLKRKNLETSILGKRKTISITEMDRSLTDLRKQNNSIVPNVVHSFDASNIALLVENITYKFKNKKMNLITIHDCFATNANDVDEMILKVKLSFIALYADRSFIENYHDFILEFLKKTGFEIEIEKNKNETNETKSYVLTDNGRFKIPTAPLFSINKNLRFDILCSQYFIN